MSGGEFHNQTGTQEAYSAVLPEIAWQHRFEGGLLRVAWSASKAIGLDPALQVEACPPDDYAGVSVQDSGLPGMNITIVGPAEAQSSAQAILEVANAQGLGTETKHVQYGVKPGRIDMVMCLPITKQDPAEDQKDYLRRTFRDKWQPFWADMVSEPGGFSYLAAHLLTEISKYTAMETLSIYRGQYKIGNTPRTYNPSPGPAMTEETYGNMIRDQLHAVLCGLEHPNDKY